MGKNHNKDKMYISSSEWASEWGGKKTGAGARSHPSRIHPRL
jgi:hypothetical protein